MNMRRLVCVAACCAVCVGTKAQTTRLPLLNLRAELRWLETNQADRRAADVSGSVTVGTVRGADGQLTLRSDQRQTEGEVLQQVLVINGGTAQIRLARAVPLQWVEAVQGPRGAATIVLRQAWAEAATGVVLRPRWPGGAAPVELEVSAEVATGTQQGSIGTQVLVPLGEWFTLATDGSQRIASQRGTLSTHDIDTRTQRELQVRITRP